MKKQRRKIILLGMLILILCIFFVQKRNNQNNSFQDELIFFKVFSSKKEVNLNTVQSENQISQIYPQYTFEVSYKNIDFKDIYLSDTINPNTLIREKIAPRNKRNI